MNIIKSTSREVNESPTRGWVMGPFAPGIARADFEVKLWHYDSQPDYPMKEFDGVEFIVIYGGVLTIEVVGHDDVVIHGDSHDYVILPPHQKRVLVTKAPAFGVTVRKKNQQT